MVFLLWMTPVPGELYNYYIHLNLPSMAPMILSCQWSCLITHFHLDCHFPGSHIQGNSINSNGCGQIVDELWTPLFTFLFWIQWTHRILLRLFVILVNLHISYFYPIQSSVQLLDKNDFFQIKNGTISWYTFKIMHPMN